MSPWWSTRPPAGLTEDRRGRGIEKMNLGWGGVEREEEEEEEANVTLGRNCATCIDDHRSYLPLLGKKLHTVHGMALTGSR